MIVVKTISVKEEIVWKGRKGKEWGDLISFSCKCLRAAATFKISLIFIAFEGHANFD